MHWDPQWLSGLCRRLGIKKSTVHILPPAQNVFKKSREKLQIILATQLDANDSMERDDTWLFDCFPIKLKEGEVGGICKLEI